MAQLNKSVDKTIVKFQDTFTYTINVGFSGIVGSISDAKVTDFIPSNISYTLPPISNVIKSIDVEKQENGDLITFNFGEITDLGISIAIKIKCKFVLGTDNGTTFKNHCDLYINNNTTPDISADALGVILDVEEDFVIEKGIVVPTNETSAPGGRVLYTIILRNRLKTQGGTGDPGAKINNIVISDILPEGISLDPNYPAKGYDISGSEYADKRYDGHLGEVTGNDIVFKMDDYYGTKYRIVLVCNVSENISTPSEIYNTSSLEISQTLRNTSTSILSIGNTTHIQSISKYGPNYAQVGNYISYDISTGNYGNQDNLNFVIEENIPNEVQPYRIKSGSFGMDIINIPIDEEYTITYFINNSETPIVLATCNLNTSTNITLPSLQEGEKITKIVWNIPNMPVGAITISNIIVDGIITSTNFNNSITNIVNGSWDGENGRESVQVTKNTVLNGKSELNISKDRVGSNLDVVPEQILRYVISFNSNTSQINNPVASDLLSNKLEYIGNEKYTFYDYFDGVVIDSTDSNFFNLVPIQKSVINDYNGTGRNFVRYTIDNFSMRQKGWLKIEFDAKVKVGAYGTITNNAILGNVGDNGIVRNGQIPYSDIDDRDNDNITQENLVISSDFNTNISYYAVLASDKKVKGALDSIYTEEPNVGKTYAGGKIDYKLIVANDGNLNYEYIEIVDILPHIGDTGVILIDQFRLSEFPVYSISSISAKVMDNNTQIEDVNLKIEYSKSYNPKRFAITNMGNDTIGSVDDWTTTPPNPITDLKSVKLSTIDLILLPGQYIEIDIHCLAPPNVQPNKIAWNSFAVKGKYRDENNVLQNMIPVEPEKVGVQVNAIDKGSIGGYVWIDSNKNGNVDPGEVGKNGIIAKLYTVDNTLVDQTMTIGNSNSLPGYYLFNNIDNGDYYVYFERPNNMYFTLYTPETQNKVNSITGKTSLISITDANKNVNDIFAGLTRDIQILILELINDIYNMDCSTNQSIISSINDFNSEFLMILGYMVDDCVVILNDNTIQDYGYKTQIVRLKEILENMILIQSSIVFSEDFCNAYMESNILITMIESLLSLLSIIEWIYGIDAYSDKCMCKGNIVYEIMVGRLINCITNLNIIINSMKAITSALMQNSSNNTKPYTTIYVKSMPINSKPIQYNPNQFICKNEKIW